MNRILLTLILFFIPLASHASELETLFEEEWQYRLQTNPMMARGMGETVENLTLPDMSLESLAAHARFYEAMLEKLNAIDTKNLTTEAMVNYQIFRDQVSNQIAEFNYGMYQIPFNSDSGFYSALARAQNNFNFETIEEYQQYLQLLESWPNYVKQQMTHMQMGLDRGFTQPQAILSTLPDRVYSYITDDIGESVFYRPFKRFPDAISAADKQRLEQQAKSVISNSVNAGYQSLGDFFKEVYIPNAKTSIGASELPQGRAFYENRIRHYTTLEMTADEIHQIGLNEVARIRSEMESIIKKTEFDGTFADFLQFLRTDPRFYAKTEEQLLEKASRIAKRADAALPAFFKHLPRTPYGVEPVPKELAPNYTTGRYVRASRNGKRPGYYWVNTYALDKRPLYELEALSLHEAVPGHHLQIALNQELDNLPNFRQYSYLSAFGEGWGLYSEWLGIEMGFYQNPYSDFGRLTYEMWRAVRLVVDTGMHAMGWSREKALAYLADNTALSLHNVRTEIDRYISWPGQALSYKIGELTIKRLRADAEKQLGNAFDIRDFHDVVLRHGAVPLNVLEQNVANYISDTLNPSNK